MFEDRERARTLVTEYNLGFNSIVFRDYTDAGEYLSLPGLAENFTPARTRRGRHHGQTSPPHQFVAAGEDSVMLRLFWTTNTQIRTFMWIWIPTNILLNALRTRRGLRWGIPTMLLSAGYFAIASWCTVMVNTGVPGGTHLIVLVCINAFKFLLNGPITAATFVAVRRRERKHN